MATTAVAPVTRKSLFDSLQDLSEEIYREKQAAGDPPDPGGFAGKSNHPTAKADNNCQPPKEGEPGKEQSKTLQEQYQLTVDGAGKNLLRPQSAVQPNLGPQQSSTGEDPKLEDGYKGHKDDPGTSHPARADENEKYGSAGFTAACLEFQRLSGSVLADLANGFQQELSKQAGSLTPTTTSAAPAAPAASASASATAASPDYLAGYDLAEALGVQKQAAYDQAVATLVATQEDSHLDAQLLGGYLLQMVERQKQAAQAPADPKEMPAPLAGEGGEGGEGGAPGGMPPDIASALGGGPGGPGGGMGGPGTGPGQGGPSEEEALQQLAMALEELGIPLEALAGLGGGGGPEGGPPGMGGPPAPGLGAPPESPDSPAKLAEAVRQYKLSGRYQIKAAASTRERTLRDQMKQHVRELFGLV